MAGNSLIGSLLVSLSADTASFDTGLKTAQSSLGKFGAMAGTIGKFAGAAIVASAAAGGAAMVTFGSQALESADNIGDAAARIGISATAYQKLGIAATQAGGSPELMSEAMDKLNAKLGAFQMSGGKAGGAFKELGLSSAIMSGEIKTADQAFYAAADALQRVTNPAEKAKLSMELFGKSAGVDMIEVTAQGGAALKAYGDQAAQTGRVMSDEMVAKLGDAKLALDAAKVSATQMAQVFAGQALIGIMDFGKELTPLWESLKQIGSQVMDFLRPSLDALGVAFKDLASNDALIVTLKTIGAIAGGVVVLSFKIMADTITIGIKALNGLFNILGNTGAALKNSAAAFVNFGKYIIDGLVKGFNDASKIAMQAVRALGVNVINAFKAVLGIHSPSKEFEVLGKYINQGLAIGLNDNAKLPIASMENISLALLQSLHGADWKSALSGELQGLLSEYESATSKAGQEMAKNLMLVDAAEAAGDAYALAFGAQLRSKILADFEKNGIPNIAANVDTNELKGQDLTSLPMASDISKNIVYDPELKNAFAQTFSDGIRAAASGNAMDFLSNKLERSLDGLLEKLGGTLYEAFSGFAQEKGGLWGTIFKGVNSLFGLSGARANGGHVNAGSTYLVGERGRELFTPSTSGSIISNDNLNQGGGDTYVTVQSMLDAQVLDERTYKISNGVVSQAGDAMATAQRRNKVYGFK